MQEINFAVEHSKKTWLFLMYSISIISDISKKIITMQLQKLV